MTAFDAAVDVAELTRDLVAAVDVAELTRDLAGRVFAGETRRRQEGRDPTRLTMSGLGGCTRACAYSIAGTPASDKPEEEEGRQAMLGTWIHDHLLPGMAALLGNDATVEEPVKLSAAGLTITGTLDLAWRDVVWDLKTVREYRLHGVRRHGIYSEHRTQVFGYALARHQAGRPVRWVCWLYLDRATGDVEIEVEPFTNGRALAVIDRVENIRVFAEDPDRAPREARGPGLSYACDRCPWLRRCWGDDATPGKVGPQTTIARTDPGVEYALALYKQASEVAAAARADQEFAKAILASTRPGTYGKWKLRFGKPGTVLDQKQVRADYAAAGRPVPETTTSGRIIVTPA